VSGALAARPPRVRLAAGLAASFLLAGVAFADEPAPKPGPETEKPKPAAKPALAALSDVEAAPLARGLALAAKGRTLEAVLPALEAIEGKTHATFEAPLVKMLAHSLGEVATRAAMALADRAGPKTGSALWRSGWLAPANKRRPEVQAAVLSAMGRAGLLLDAKQYDEVESLWRKQTNARTVTLIAGYFAAVKTDKRPLRLLSEALDEPGAGSVNSPTNPPASYWEARWKMWQATKPAIQEAVQAITGQKFESSAEAKAWFDANPKFGFDW
jgi:hypothetical protein